MGGRRRGKPGERGRKKREVPRRQREENKSGKNRNQRHLVRSAIKAGATQNLHNDHQLGYCTNKGPEVRDYMRLQKP